jgi:hypothetical protein
LDLRYAAASARDIDVMQEAALTTLKIYNYLHASEEHFAICPMQRLAVRSIAHASKGVCYTNLFV